MAAPTRADFKYYGCANPTPNDDTDDLGGAIDTSPELDPNTQSNLWSTLSIGSTDQDYYSVHYRKAEHTAPGTAANARFYNRAGAKLNTGAGTATIVSNSSSEDIQVKIYGKVSGSWDTETLTIEGTTPAVGSKTWDAGQVWRWECVSGTPIGLLTCSVNSETVAVIYGTSDDPSDGNSESIATYMASAETQWALASAKNADLSSSDRKTAPTGIGSFSRATYWAGADASINVPTGSMSASDYIGIVGKLTLNGNVPQPGRDFQVMMGILFDAQSS